jgi:hypothetical protein
MHRLLQGDVGSGKTVVAALAAAICIAGGYQCALMAPTEILAEQHFRKLIGWLEPLGITTAWLTGSQKAKERRAMLALIASGRGGAGDRHPCGDPGQGGVPQAGAGHHRRAAPVRCGPAAGAARQDAVRAAGTGGCHRQKLLRPMALPMTLPITLPMAMQTLRTRPVPLARLLRHRQRRLSTGAALEPAHDERHADSAHPGHGLLRRPGCVDHRQPAAGAHAHRHQAGQRGAPRRGHRPHPRPAGRRAGRCIGSAR